MRIAVPLVVRERDAADMLGVSTAALRRWRRESRGPAFIRLEGCIRYRLADLEEFLAKHTAPCDAQYRAPANARGERQAGQET